MQDFKCQHSRYFVVQKQNFLKKYLYVVFFSVLSEVVSVNRQKTYKLANLLKLAFVWDNTFIILKSGPNCAL